MNSIEEDKDAFRPDVIELLANSKDDIIAHFGKKK